MPRGRKPKVVKFTDKQLLIGELHATAIHASFLACRRDDLDVAHQWATLATLLELLYPNATSRNWNAEHFPKGALYDEPDTSI